MNPGDYPEYSKEAAAKLALYTGIASYNCNTFYDKTLPALKAAESKLNDRFKIVSCLEEDGRVEVRITSDEYSFSPFWDEVRAYHTNKGEVEDNGI